MAGCYGTAIATAAATSGGFDIVKRLLDSFKSEHVVLRQNLTEAEELVNGLSFDFYQERFSCKRLTKIKLNDFETVVNRIATRNNIPQDKKEEILDGKYAQENEAYIKEFVFEKGNEPGRLCYGRVLTIKREDDTIDMAYVIYYLEFKLSPNRIEETKQKCFLGFVYGTETVVRYEHRTFREEEQNRITTFYRAKALKGLQAEYGALKYY